MKVFIKITKLFLILFLCILLKKYLFIRTSKSVINYSYKDSYLIDSINDTIEYQNGIAYYQKPYQYNKYLYIIGDNLKKDSYVINNDGLIGKIIKEYDKYALVELITNENFIIQVNVNDCLGIYQNKKITNIDINCNIKKGDKVYLSNLEMINNNILIGTIDEILIDKNNISNNYIIKNSVNFNKLSNLLIISRSIS